MSGAVVLGKQALLAFLQLYELCILGYALSSWFVSAGGAIATVHGMLATLCEPLVGLVRRLLPAAISGGAGVDLSPLVAMLLLIAAQNLIRSL